MEWLYGASESSNMEVDIGYLPQVCAHVYAEHLLRVLICGMHNTNVLLLTFCCMLFSQFFFSFSQFFEKSKPCIVLLAEIHKVVCTK